MRYWVGLTDRDWYEFLAHRSPDEVNFWQPSASRPVHLEPGAPFLFKLHASAGGRIVGGGYFAHYTRTPISMAWDVFGEKNGVATLAELVSRVRRCERHEPGSETTKRVNLASSHRGLYSALAAAATHWLSKLTEQ